MWESTSYEEGIIRARRLDPGESMSNPKEIWLKQTCRQSLAQFYHQSIGLTSVIVECNRVNGNIPQGTATDTHLPNESAQNCHSLWISRNDGLSSVVIVSRFASIFIKKSWYAFFSSHGSIPFISSSGSSCLPSPFPQL